jgi:hypothetical protein
MSAPIHLKYQYNSIVYVREMPYLCSVKTNRPFSCLQEQPAFQTNYINNF